MSFIIRKASIDDAADLAFIGRKTFIETWREMSDPANVEMYADAAYNLNVIQKELADSAITYFIAKEKDEIVGYIKLSRKQELGNWITEHCIEICRLYVLKLYHDKKMGKQLMETCIDLAKQENFKSIVLGVWENNYRAVAFYRKWGFEVIGTHPFVMGNQTDTDWVMRKTL